MAEKPNETTQTLSLPKGGGAIKGIGEIFRPDLFSGTGNFSVPIYTSPGRNGFGPKLTLDYSTGNGNGPFGLGWSLSIPRVTRKTEKGLPRYDNTDVFVLSGAEDLVPTGPPTSRAGYTITGFRPRTEGLFSRIERWEDANGEAHWRATTKDNVTSIYGKTAIARLADPANPRRVYEWLLQETFDARGNHILYEYSREDQTIVPPAVYEDNRVYTQLYIRRIFYGNSNGAVGPRRVGTDHRDPLAEVERRYLFEVFFDYGDLIGDSDGNVATGPVASDWFLRPDPFSTYRSGFESRTLRRCRRIIMYHHAAELGGAIWVKSTDFAYDSNPDTLISFLVSVTLNGYRRVNGSYRTASLPPVAFRYSAFRPTEQRYQSVRANGDAFPPLPLSDPDVALVDLFGKGLPDLLHTTSSGFRYWKNVGGGVFDRPRTMPHAPAGVLLSQGAASFADLAGDGRADLLVLNGTLRGFYETTPDGDWLPLRLIQSTPTLTLDDRNARLLDLTGDGLTDVLVTRERHFLWYECLGEAGYAPPQIIPRVYDLNEFPDVSFDDPTGRVRLADMNGDGLLDIVLLHNGRIDYWPNLGYGRFGKRVTMAGAPRLERDFDPARLFLADLDGSGCADLVYVESGRVRFWFNRSGNSWSDEQIIYGTPDASNQAAIRFADFYGTGTTALIWSYALNRQPDGNYKVLDSCGGVKPYLLVEMDNHMGATTRVEYAASTRFYLEDEAAGEPWITRLSFPVQVVAKVEVIDHVSRAKLTTTYKYHHGYFDGHEREFRGFGRVDRFDTEYFADFAAPGLYDTSVPFDNAAPEYYLPPIETRTWFHTGIYFDQTAPGQIFDYDDLEQAYRRRYYADDPQAFTLDSHDVETGGIPGEAYRALRGAILRTEVYARDGTAKAEHPYQVTENRYRVRLLQPKGNNRHAVYHTTTLESLTYHYERQPADPRLRHLLNLRVDDFGNITNSVTVAYPRRATPPNLPEQAETKILYTHSDFINVTSEEDFYYVSLPYQTRLYEITGLPQQRYQLADFDPLLADPDDFVPYHRQPTPGTPQKRIVDWTRTYYRSDAEPDVLDPPAQLDHRLDLGVVERLGLPYETYRAALTQDLIDGAYENDPSGSPRITPAILSEGGYHAELDTPNTWWIPGGRTGYNEAGFYQPIRTQDAFGNISQTVYDSYDLLVEQAIDPFTNTILAANDYRVLQPRQITDPNGDIAETVFDALGFVAATALRSGGDSLTDAPVDLSPLQLDAIYASGGDVALLGRATTAFVYDLHRYERNGQPNFVLSLALEIHEVELNGAQAPMQRRWTYSDGFGREVQTKVQAEADNGIFADDVLADRPIAYYRLNESIGATTAIDASGNGHHGDFSASEITLQQPGLGAGDTAALFSGQGTGRIIVSDSEQLNPKHITLEALISWAGPTGSTQQRILEKSYSAWEPVWPTYGLSILQDGSVRVELLIIGQAEPVFVTSKARLTANVATHLATTYDGRAIEIYINGMLDVAFAVTGEILSTFGSSNIGIGNQVERARQFNGIIDEVALYDKALSAERIRSHFAKVKDGNAPRKRWVGSGWTIYNNKGKPVQKYEPFFSLTHQYKFNRRNGVSSTLFYDPLERIVATLHPNHTYEKAVFDAWVQATWDANDTVRLDPRTDADVSGYLSPYLDTFPNWQTWLRERIDPDNPPSTPTPEEAAAIGTLPHAATPTIAHLDSLGRAFLTIADNGAAGQYATHLKLDIEGNTLAITDALNRIILTQQFDLSGAAIVTNSRDAGRRRLLNNAVGEPLRAWNARGDVTRTTYDALQRPRNLYVRLETEATWRLVERAIYGESSDAGLTPGQIATGRLRGKLYQQYDGAGVVIFERYDFKGNLDRSSRTLTQDFNLIPNWENPLALETESHTAETHYDALNRPDLLTAPDGSQIRPIYNPAGLLDQVEVRLPGGDWQSYVTNVGYNARGQRESIAYGNGVTTDYAYDPLTYHLTNLRTRRGATALQDLSYTYDPVGNITRIEDAAQQTIFFNNQVVNALSSYVYDALYRLVGADGREHIGQVSSPWPTWDDAPRMNHPHPNNGQAMRRYCEAYEYDAVGNIESLTHHAGNEIWTRQYEYVSDTNRLLRTTVNGTTSTYQHDDDGNMTALDAITLDWNFKDQLERADLGGGVVYYAYDPAGQRVRKVAVKNRGSLVEERIYLGIFEIFRRSNGSGLALQRNTLHVVDDKRRIALIETRVLGAEGPRQLIRYQLDNHLGSTCLELDENADLISFEEYYPYGSTSYHAARTGLEANPNHYRYTGKERDAETGLYYHGARYYAPWLGRWTSCDPMGMVDGVNVYVYVADNPITNVDRTGTQRSHVFEASEVTGRKQFTMQQAAESYREFDQVGDREAAAFYHRQLKQAVTQEFSEQSKFAYKTMALLWAPATLGGVGGGLAGGAALTFMAGGAKATLGMKLGAAAIGGLLGGSVEVGSEQLLRAGFGIELMSKGEAGLRIAASTVFPVAGTAGLKALPLSSNARMTAAITELNQETVTVYRLMSQAELGKETVRAGQFVTTSKELVGRPLSEVVARLDVATPTGLASRYSSGGALIRFETTWGNLRLPKASLSEIPQWRSSLPVQSGLTGALPPVKPATEFQLIKNIAVPMQPTVPYLHPKK